MTCWGATERSGIDKMNNETVLDIIEQETIETAHEEYMEMERLYLDGDLEV